MQLASCKKINNSLRLYLGFFWVFHFLFLLINDVSILFQNSIQHSKWEKADILEMAVEYLQQLRSAQPCSLSPSTSSISTPPTPKEEIRNIKVPLNPIASFLNPMMQQYVAYQQLAQLSMYTQLFNNPAGVPLRADAGVTAQSPELAEKLKIEDRSRV